MREKHRCTVDTEERTCFRNWESKKMIFIRAVFVHCNSQIVMNPLIFWIPQSASVIIGCQALEWFPSLPSPLVYSIDRQPGWPLIRYQQLSPSAKHRAANPRSDHNIPAISCKSLLGGTRGWRRWRRTEEGERTEVKRYDFWSALCWLLS